MLSIMGSISVAAALSALVGRGALVKSSTLLAPSIWQGSPDRSTIALTFDDGPSESTPRLLDILDRYQVKATFFQCGFSVDRLPEIAREVSSRGHELGNHTYSHPRLWLKSPSFIERELASAQEAIMDATSVRPQLFRAPFGLRWIGLRSAQKRLGLTGVLWSVIGFDWQWPAVSVARHVLAQARNGAIVCLHDGRRLNKNPEIGATLTAAETVIPALLERGFKFETVSQMLAACDAAPAKDQRPGRKVPSIPA
jgi:peptidoglycan/xylan/chitin deacetylase (PgdA/CDA1 family)